MGFSFGNLLGFWALLGIPAVLLVHFLQRRSRVLEISTLFLLEQMQRESVSGNRIERLRSSMPLWLQLLMVVVLTWLLVEPRWPRRETVQRVAIVLDSSASMSVFKEEVLLGLDAALDDLASLVTTTELVLLETRGGRGLYTGTDRRHLRQAIGSWEPYLGAHAPGPALRLARSTVGVSGLVVFVTDHVRAERPPFDARLLAVGSSQSNCGFAGFNVGQGEDGRPSWNVLIRNYGTEIQERRWWLEAGQRRTSPTALALAPGEVVPLRGAFPEGVDRCTLVMEGDAFAYDDRLPIVVPRPKRLTVSIPVSGGEALVEFYRQAFASFEHVVLSSDRRNSDLTVATYDPLDPRLPPGSACVFVSDSQTSRSFLTGQIVSVENSMIDGLNWQGLLCREALRIPGKESDEVLLWQGERPLIFIRGSGESQQLCFNFDLRSSNARRLPAFAVLLHRFLSRVRHTKVATEAQNFETGQRIELACNLEAGAPPLELRLLSEGAAATIPLDRRGQLRAPALPDLFELWQGSKILVSGGSHFADTREADLRNAASANDLAGAKAAMFERHSQADGSWRFWVLTLLGILLVSWYFARKPVQQDEAGPSPGRIGLAGRNRS